MWYTMDCCLCVPLQSHMYSSRNASNFQICNKTHDFGVWGFLFFSFFFCIRVWFNISEHISITYFHFWYLHSISIALFFPLTLQHFVMLITIFHYRVWIYVIYMYIDTDSIRCFTINMELHFLNKKDFHLLCFNGLCSIKNKSNEWKKTLSLPLYLSLSFASMCNYYYELPNNEPPNTEYWI